MQEFYSIAVYNPNQVLDISGFRAIRMYNTQHCPMQVIISESLNEVENWSNIVQFSLLPSVVICNDVPPSALRLSSKINPLLKDSIRPQKTSAIIFLSEHLKNIYQINTIPSLVLRPFIRSFWDGRKQKSNRITTWVKIPAQGGRYDVNSLTRLQNVFGGVILNTLIQHGPRWMYYMRDILLSSKCFINLSYCDPDIFPFLIAANLGCPVISLENIFIQELFQDTAFFISNINELSKIDNIKLLNISKQQQSFIRDNFYNKREEITQEWKDVFLYLSRQMVR